MNLIIPMAGRGTRLRPHTLVTPKPLIPIAGEPIVGRLITDIANVCSEQIEHIGFIVGDFFNEEIKTKLTTIAKKIGAKPHFYIQDKALGTAHAVWCANDLLTEKTLIAFADTLFRAEFKLDSNNDGIIWTKYVDDPSAFGVVKTDKDGIITQLVEKPDEPISNQAIIGIYYIKEGNQLKVAIDNILTNNIKSKGEFQLTDALEQLKVKGKKFKIGEVSEWLDCGNKDITVESNGRYLHFLKGEELIHKNTVIKNSEIIPPVSIDMDTEIINSKIGPNVSIGRNCKIIGSTLSSALVQSDSTLKDVNLTNSMIGNHVKIHGQPRSVSLGDYTEW